MGLSFQNFLLVIITSLSSGAVLTVTLTYLQFGAGNRVCLGKNISLLEVAKVVPTVLRHFDVGATPQQNIPRADMIEPSR